MSSSADAMRRPSLLRNAVSNWGAFLYVAAVSFFLSPVIVRSLGTTGYGVWSMLIAVVGYLGLLDFGVRGAVTRYVAHYHAAKDLKASSLIATSAILLFGALGTIAVLISGLLSWAAPLLFNIPLDFVADARAVLIIGGFTIALTLIGAVYGGVVTGLERFDVSSGVEIGLTTLRSAAVLAVLKLGYGLVALAWIHLASAALYGITMRVVVRCIYPQLRLDFSENLTPHVRKILSFSLVLSVIHVLAMVIFYTDAFVIAAMLPIAAVGFYAIAVNLSTYTSQVAGALSKIFTPRVSSMHSEGSQQIGEAVLRGCRMATVVTLPIVITFFLRGTSFINIWMGEEYGPASGEVLRVLAVALWVGSARAVAASAIIGVNMHRRLVPILGFEAAANLVLSIALAPILGILGVAVGTLIPALIVSLVLIPRCLRNTVGVPVQDYLSRAIVMPTVSCLPFAAATYIAETAFPTSSMLTFFGQVALVLPIAAAGAFVVCFTAKEKSEVLLLLQDRKRRA